MCARTDLLLFPRGFSASALLHRIGERDRIFKCGAMIACAPTPVRRPSAFGLRAGSEVGHDSQFQLFFPESSKSHKNGGKKKGKGREGGSEGEPRQAMHVVARARTVREGRWKTTSNENTVALRLLSNSLGYVS